MGSGVANVRFGSVGGRRNEVTTEPSGLRVLLLYIRFSAVVFAVLMVAGFRFLYAFVTACAVFCTTFSKYCRLNFDFLRFLSMFGT